MASRREGDRQMKDKCVVSEAEQLMSSMPSIRRKGGAAWGLL